MKDDDTKSLFEETEVILDDVVPVPDMDMSEMDLTDHGNLFREHSVDNLLGESGRSGTPSLGSIDILIGSDINISYIGNLISKAKEEKTPEEFSMFLVDLYAEFNSRYQIIKNATG